MEQGRRTGRLNQWALVAAGGLLAAYVAVGERIEG